MLNEDSDAIMLIGMANTSLAIQDRSKKSLTIIFPPL